MIVSIVFTLLVIIINMITSIAQDAINGYNFILSLFFVIIWIATTIAAKKKKEKNTLISILSIWVFFLATYFVSSLIEATVVIPLIHITFWGISTAFLGFGLSVSSQVADIITFIIIVGMIINTIVQLVLVHRDEEYQ